MVTARLTLQPQIHTMSAHVRYMLINMFMAPSGVLLALEFLNALNDWYWLICALLNLFILLAASLVENRRITAGGIEVLRSLFETIERTEGTWRAERLAAKKASRRAERSRYRHSMRDGVEESTDTVQDQEEQEGQEGQDEISDFSTDAASGTGISFGLVSKDVWDDQGRVLHVCTTLYIFATALYQRVGCKLMTLQVCMI